MLSTPNKTQKCKLISSGLMGRYNEAGLMVHVFDIKAECNALCNQGERGSVLKGENNEESPGSVYACLGGGSAME